jgi:hypothetical protein
LGPGGTYASVLYCRSSRLGKIMKPRALKLKGDSLKLIWAEFSTLS